MSKREPTKYAPNAYGARPQVLKQPKCTESPLASESSIAGDRTYVSPALQRAYGPKGSKPLDDVTLGRRLEK